MARNVALERITNAIDTMSLAELRVFSATLKKAANAKRAAKRSYLAQAYAANAKRFAKQTGYSLEYARSAHYFN